MATEILTIDNTHLEELGGSLNYMPETLESLLVKKANTKRVDDLKEKVARILEPAADFFEDDSIENYKKSFISIKEKCNEAKSFLDESIESVDRDFSTSLNSVLETIITSSDLADEKFSELTPELEETANIEFSIRNAYYRVVKDVNKLNKKQTELDDLVLSDKALLLSENEQAADYFLGCIATAVFNEILPDDDDAGLAMANIRQKVLNLSTDIDDKINQHLNAILHDENFKALESNWLGLQGLIESTDWSANIMIDMLDCTKEELREDLENNSVDLTNSDLFKKIYVAEYDQYGGNPYGSILGLYEFENSEPDRKFLSTMGKVAAASHAPFISSVGPEFFGCESIQELADIKDLDAHLNHPRFDKWNELRGSEEAAYLGMTLPKFLLRAPYEARTNSGGIGFDERIDIVEGHKDYLWGNAALLFCKNMIQSFSDSGWCQYIRGPKGGGLIEYLPSYSFNLNGQQELKSPIEMTIPDYRELQFANAGFIPLIYRKGSSDACFFSSQSIRKSKQYKDPKDSENSQLVSNLSYTFSITRIAHYIKCIMRDNIGTSATSEYINEAIQSWLSQYVTTVENPDDRTLRYYPFKAVSAETEEREGMIGWYNSKISILPHLQFEGMDVELKLDVRT
ncbi:type VI secretion system contractile sheath large subunit [uncultured Shewanella sp.]|uniref:type VI secretion system contractile sheath large subunit n=1 Tax=uncultured Shewanella sp. TaxID=173975 RepID=UPI002630724F|nr:type VI secretion system contractile sheath large subunit [uncultured Shewanella sp.]